MARTKSEQYASYKANRRRAAAGAKYGTSYEQQGYRPEKEAGASYLKLQELKAKEGPFAEFLANWDVEWRAGEPYLRPRANQTGRIEHWGQDPSEYKHASEVLTPGHWAAFQRTRSTSAKGQARRNFIESVPGLAERPGGGMDAWTYQRYLRGLQTDPATGYKVNQAGELYDPNALLPGGSGRGQVNMSAGYQGAPFGSQPFGQYPGYASPFGQPYSGIPGYANYAFGGGNQQYQVNAPRYSTLQQQGGSTFGYHSPYQYNQQGGLFSNYQPQF